MKRLLLATLLSFAGTAVLASGTSIDELIAGMEKDGYSHIELVRVDGRTAINGYKDGWHRTMVVGADGAFESSWQLQAPNASEEQARIEAAGNHNVLSRLINLVSVGAQ